MATASRADIERRLTQLRNQLTVLQQQIVAVESQMRALSAEANRLGRLAGSTGNREFETQGSAKSRESLDLKNTVLRPLQNQEFDVETEIKRLEQELINLNNSSAGLASAGTIQQNAATARDDDANTQIPEQPPAVLDAEGRIISRPDVTVPSNALPPTAGNTPIDSLDLDGPNRIEQNRIEQNVANQSEALREDQNLDAPVRTLSQTQAVGSPEPVATEDATAVTGNGTNDAGRISSGQSSPAPASAAINTSRGPTAPRTPGTGAPDDDNFTGPGTGGDGGGATNATQNAINRRFGDAIVAQPNVLNNFSSYTYTISLYLMDPQDYNRLVTNKTKLLGASQLLMQSAGIPNGTRTPQTNDNGAITGGDTISGGRNQFFPLDFFIDDLKMKSVLPGKGARMSHNVVEMEFKIIEPYGITLFENLYRACQQFVASRSGTSGPQNYAAQTYLMVIRYYGYDENGNLSAPPTADSAAQTDRNAIVEKFIPFIFTGIKFRVANRLTEYQCTAVCPQNYMGTSDRGGTIPYQVEFTATTLKNLLTGTAEFNQNPSAPPPNAGQAPVGNLVNGLADALNRYQEELVNTGKQSKADVYRIVIVEPELQNAKLRPPGQLDLSSVGAFLDTTAAGQLDGSKQNVNTDSRTFGAPAGTPIIKFIDLAVRNSTYIYDQQTKIVDPKTGEVTPQGSAITPAWFRIGVQTEYNDYDDIRKDYAATITYQISMYKVTQIKSDWWPQGRYQGAHKKYDYWFTGQNNAIMRYEQDYNYLFYITLNTTNPTRPAATSSTTTEYREEEKRQYSPRSRESAAGAKEEVNEPGANAADWLYSPGDQAQVKIEIVGDPAWIQQGEVWQGVGGPSITDQAAINFLPDGTINFETQEVLFQISWNRPADYNIETGLMDIPRRQ